jgi:hypothetical protein
MESTRFTINKDDLTAIGKGALIAAGGALLTYITSYVTSTDFGQWTPVIVSVWSIIVNVSRKYLSGEVTEKPMD